MSSGHPEAVQQRQRVVESVEVREVVGRWRASATRSWPSSAGRASSTRRPVRCWRHCARPLP